MNILTALQESPVRNSQNSVMYGSPHGPVPMDDQYGHVPIDDQDGHVPMYAIIHGTVPGDTTVQSHDITPTPNPETDTESSFLMSLPSDTPEYYPLYHRSPSHYQQQAHQPPLRRILPQTQAMRGVILKHLLEHQINPAARFALNAGHIGPVLAPPHGPNYGPFGVEFGKMQM